MSNNGYDPLQPLTIQYVANLLGRTKETIYGYIKSGYLRAIQHYEGQRHPKTLIVLRKDLEEFLYSENGYNNYRKHREQITLVSNSK